MGLTVADVGAQGRGFLASLRRVVPVTQVIEAQSAGSYGASGSSL
jgi:hypothetical protein